jgi:hypothetical protein
MTEEYTEHMTMYISKADEIKVKGKVVPVCNYKLCHEDVSVA